VEALAYAEKSVSIYHRLADRYPDGRHQPGLAVALARRGRLQQLDGELEAASESYYAGLVALEPPFMASRDVFEKQMNSLVHRYLDICVARRVMPDHVRIARIVDTLNSGIGGETS
jgi:hypothetical protein